MANSIIEINTNTLRSDISSIEADIVSLRSEAAKLRDGANYLGSTWDGPAKEAFMAQFLGDVDSLERLIDVMFKFTQQTDESRVAYENCENEVGQMIASIQV